MKLNTKTKKILAAVASVLTAISIGIGVLLNYSDGKPVDLDELKDAGKDAYVDVKDAVKDEEEVVAE